MTTPITDKAPRTQERVLNDGADIINARFFRGVKSVIRAEVNKNYQTLDKIDFDQLNSKIVDAMTFAFLVASGKITLPERNFEFATVLDSTGFRFDMPFKEALSAWKKANPANIDILEQVQANALIMAGNVAQITDALVRSGVTRVLEQGLSLDKVRNQIMDQADAGAAHFETALRTSVATAQNAGHALRQRSSPIVALLEYRGIEDRRQTGAPGGIYAGKGQSKNPGFCRQLSTWNKSVGLGFMAPPDHEVWKTLYPPNHFNCRSWAIAVSWPRADDKGLTKKDGKLKAKYADPTIPPFVADGSWPAEGFEQSPVAFLGVN